MASVKPNPAISTQDAKRVNRWPWAWYAYTGFLLIAPAFDPSLPMWLGTLLVLAVFTWIFYRFVRCSNQDGGARIWMIVATMALGLVTFPWNAGATTFFIYAAAFLPFAIVSVRRVLLAFLAESALVLGEALILHTPRGFLHVTWPNAFVAIFLMAIIGGSNIFFAQQKRADAQLRSAHEENIALAALAERERIARDLHDVLGHTLSVIVLKAELANRLMQRDAQSDHQRAAAEIADVERIARTSLAEVREAIGGYRARGLQAEIEAARQTLDAAGVKLILDSDSQASDALRTTHLTAAEETALSLALREAVTNIVRHARATTCKLRFVNEAGQRRLVVEDNGEHVASREGNGLRGMRERIESLGGKLSLERDHGTRLLIELPLRTQPDAAQAS